MISVKNLTKYYGTHCALSDVSFAVKKGEILGFLGPNAAGKTTTMRILTCFMPATSGEAEVAGYDVFHDGLEVRKRIGYLPESVPLYSNMTVTEYLWFVAEAKRMPRAERARGVATVIEECGLGAVKDRLIGKLSKGFRQRVGLAQAIVNHPEVLILDEPTIGLDPRQIIEIRNLIKSLGGEHTIILSSHILPEVSMTCERVVIINRGKVIAEDTPDNLSARHGGVSRISLVVDGSPQTAANAIQKVAGIKSVKQEESKNTVHSFLVEAVKDRDIRRELAASVVNAGLGLLEMHSLSLSLEEVFVQLVTEEDRSDAAEAAAGEEVQ